MAEKKRTRKATEPKPEFPTPDVPGGVSDDVALASIDIDGRSAIGAVEVKKPRKKSTRKRTASRKKTTRKPPAKRKTSAGSRKKGR
jgi:hypothetical protein